MIETVGTWWMWLGFVAFVMAMVLVDIFALRTDGARKVSAREALAWSAMWVALALLFNLGLWW